MGRVGFEGEILVFFNKDSHVDFYLSQQCMGKRFDGSQQALDLNNIRLDPGNYTRS